MANLTTETRLSLLNGTSGTIRGVRPGDAAAIMRLEEITREDREQQGEDPDGLVESVTERENWISAVMNDASWLVVVAAIEDHLVGMLEFRAFPLPRLTSHVGRFYVSVVSDWRGQGIGRALVEKALAWADSHAGIEKVAISALHTNGPALALYRGLGFREEGRRSREFKLKDGTFADEILFARFKQR